MEVTSVVEITGITGYRLVGLLLAIAGLVKATLSVKGISAPLDKIDLVVGGVFGIMCDRFVNLCMELPIDYGH